MSSAGGSPLGIVVGIAATVSIFVLLGRANRNSSSRQAPQRVVPLDPKFDFLEDDLKKVAHRALGYRHQSSDISLSLSNGVPGANRFLSLGGSADLGTPLSRKAYETRLTKFIVARLKIDAGEIQLGKTTKEQVLTQLAQSRFALLDYTKQPSPPLPNNQGILEKRPLEEGFITPIPTPDIPISENQRQETLENLDSFLNHVARYYRGELMTVIRDRYEAHQKIRDDSL